MSKPGILFNELIDQYKLEKHLSQKRVTDHFLAFDVDENDRVSVEILLPNLANHKTYASRFISKIQSVAQLNHPHIAQIFQVGIAPNERPYFAREYIEGITLKERFQELKNQDHPVHSIYALKLVRQITDALSLAERLDIFHHDLNPENILFQSDGKITLVDIGIPRVSKTENDQFLGNITFDTRYWSPEQVHGKPMDARSHVYSLGVILFEVLTGHVIQENSSSGSRLSRRGNKSALENLRSDLAPETIRLVQKALRASPRGRFQNSSDFLSAIDEAIQAEEFVLHSGNRLGGRAPLPRVLLTVGAPIGIVLLATIIGFLLVRNGNSSTIIEEDPTPIGIIVDAIETDTAVPPTATATSTIEPVDTEVPITASGLTLSAPANGETIRTNGSFGLNWEWNEPLDENQEFIVVGTFEGDQFVFEDISISNSGTTYEAQVAASILNFQEGAYEWQVILLSSITRTAIAQSEVRSFIFESTATATPTLTPTSTQTATPPATATPEITPEVRVVASSVSLRSGPSTRYDVLQFLFEGDVVSVIGKIENGTWLNVITEDGTFGWLSTTISETIGDTDLTAVPTPATIPAEPTATATPIPTATPTETPIPPPSDGGGGGNNGGGGGGGGNNQPPTKTPPPP
ncbi:MAG: serine/threonine protein kinase [Chloroflexota bacterium]